MSISKMSMYISEMLPTLFLFLLVILNNIDLNVYLKDVHVHQ